MKNELLKRSFTSIILLIVFFFCLFKSQTTWLYLLIFFTVICFYEFYNLLRKIFKINLIFILYISLIALYLYYFQLSLTKIRTEYNENIILILLSVCIFSDIGGYIVGKSIGGPKLTTISPNKTISGAIGSILLAIIGTFSVNILLDVLDQRKIITYVWIIAMSIFCQIGDLFISFLKRKAKVKDTGNILPGHGGILDRVDGLIIAVPFGILTFFN
tara:strand:- start:412 stop:1059 length:648 start_codon:yes stop_codon:yes gene_type:complete